MNALGYRVDLDARISIQLVSTVGGDVLLPVGSLILREHREVLMLRLLDRFVANVVFLVLGLEGPEPGGKDIDQKKLVNHVDTIR